MDTKAPPVKHLVGREGGPTLDDLLKLYRALTGREPTAEDIADAQATLDEP